MRRSAALLLLALCTSSGTPSPPRTSGAQVADTEPDIRKATSPRWPNERDLARLVSVEGKPRWRVLQVLGHPSAVRRNPDGTEVWTYPWLAGCQVGIRDGVCTWTFYTGGF